jgi:Domain of unknown function (DUF4276)
MLKRKLAIFVEGFTEQQFTIRLLQEIVTGSNITFVLQKQMGGNLIFTGKKISKNEEFLVLIIDCSNDEQVKSQIIDKHGSLHSNGYDLIIGLRDVYPHLASEIPELKKRLNYGLPTKNPPVHLHLAIMEVEAWFLEEISHFKLIDSNITEDVLSSCGFNINTLRACDLPNPASILDSIYKIVNKRYLKKAKSVQRTIDTLSYEQLYIDVRNKAPSLNDFITSIEIGLALINPPA